ncbi:hypothetical protein CEXT_24691 [Caerostris extrusa]|uniref:Uncharacterized protein n=1 Tax=Caerostris extrusa TaxID=172846 RepID=A0AAV4V9E5_CAEEX|nr:hypothetical protein CEXT_24691 [Caerostris extrusa]
MHSYALHYPRKREQPSKEEEEEKRSLALGKTENPDPGTTFPFIFLPECSLRFFGLTSVSGCHPSRDPRHEVPSAYPFYHLDRSLISRFISGIFFIDVLLLSHRDGFFR